MRLILTLTAASLLATSGMAAQCRDPKTQKFIKCPPAAAAKVTRCKNEKTKKFQKCGTPGAVPA